MSKIEELIGKTMTSVERIDDYVIRFESTEGETYKLYHEQDCCESVGIEDICGDLNDLVGNPILLAEEVTSNQINPEGVKVRVKVPEYQGSSTWTFYKFATIRGSVTVRWLGESNGYYSETVTFEDSGDPAPRST